MIARCTLIGLLVLAVSLPAGRADVRLPAVISDHMVLQAATPAPIWGWAAPGERVVVAFAGQSFATVAATDGTWRVRLPPLAVSRSPQTLTVSGNNSLVVHDVLVGEAWLCSGQSNMEMQLKGLHGQVDRADAEIAAADYPLIRMFEFETVYDIYQLPVPPREPQAERAGKWTVCSPQTAARFIALGYFFAREIHEKLGRTPIGLVHSSVGGTPIEAWTSRPAQQSVPELQPVLMDWARRLADYDPAAELRSANAAKARWVVARDLAKTAGQPPPKAPAPFKNLRVSEPAGLFNGLIAPLVPFALRGVLWYQGERNAAGPLTALYGRQLRVLIADWRARWGDDLYFAWVQLPAFQKPQRAPSEPNGWGVWVRDGQRQTLAVPRTGMAVTIDLGGESAGHPTNKADFAHRLALLALHDVYGQKIAVWSGPIFKSLQRAGRELVISFDHETGLKARADPTGVPNAPAELKGFALAGADGKFVWAHAKIAGERVVVSSAQVPEPVAVRYAWAANPLGNLVNAAGLPASPFATDDGK
jgi:sialate O-acetylesterase